ncbi:MAG: histidinol-phosphate transaminase [Candidatus Margulisbacteria bacterium]|nr:histidinol-phosphate transaminase [Candidatus Margulisiibacteriota bacterium]
MQIKRRLALQSLKPYVPGKSLEEVDVPHAIKMASNENPMGSPLGPEDYKAIFQDSQRYPSYSKVPLLKLLSDVWDVGQEQIILGNGSDDILMMVALAYINSGDTVISAKETFSEYHFCSVLCEGEFIPIPLQEYGYDLNKIQEKISEKTRLIFISNPNNPTGTLLSKERLSAFLAQVPSHVLVILDEAYMDYVESEDHQFSKYLLQKYSNLLVLRTFSKIFGLAGFRIGYGVGHESVIQTLNMVRAPFNVNAPAMKAAGIAIQKQSFISESKRINQKGKKYLYDALGRLGLDYIPTEANFIMIHVPQDADRVMNKLLPLGVIVRSLSSYGYPRAIRVTIGLEDQNRRFIDALRRVLRKEDS